MTDDRPAASTLILVGCGNMGHAMLEAWMATSPRPDVLVVEPHAPLRERAAATGATAVGTVQDLPADTAPDFIVLAVKPQMMSAVLPAYARWGGGGTAFLSVAAGIPMERIEAMLPAPTPVLRCMPNTPAGIGEGVMALCANQHASTAQVDASRRLLGDCGIVLDIRDEAMMDAVTAVSGSGPAYLFHFIEALTDAALAVGLPEALARAMALQTIVGAAKLAAQSPEAADTLRRNVTSPGGTTAAALGVLMGGDALTVLVTAAVQAARDRSIELRTAP